VVRRNKPKSMKARKYQGGGKVCVKHRMPDGTIMSGPTHGAGQTCIEWSDDNGQNQHDRYRNGGKIRKPIRKRNVGSNIRPGKRKPPRPYRRGVGLRQINFVRTANAKKRLSNSPNMFGKKRFDFYEVEKVYETAMRKKEYVKRDAKGRLV